MCSGLLLIGAGFCIMCFELPAKGGPFLYENLVVFGALVAVIGLFIGRFRWLGHGFQKLSRWLFKGG